VGVVSYRWVQPPFKFKLKVVFKVSLALAEKGEAFKLLPVKFNH
jgi:hypothetical protein